MGNSYNQLTLTERYQMEALTKLNLSAREIGRRLNRSNKTISEDLRSCDFGAYSAESVHRNADVKKRTARKKNEADRTSDTTNILAT